MRYFCAIFGTKSALFHAYSTYLFRQFWQKPDIFFNFLIKKWRLREKNFFLGAVHILRNTGWGGGLPDLLQYYIGGVSPIYYNITYRGPLESLLQYYSFERKMEGFNPFSALN